MKGQTAIPETSEELEELLNDNDRLTDVLKNGQFGDLTQAYIAKAMASERAELGAQMREQMELGKQQILQDWAEQGMTPQNGFRPGGTAVSNRDARAAKAIAKAGRRVGNAAYLAESQHLFSPSAMGAQFDDEPYAQSMRAFMHTMWKAEHVAKESGNGDRVAEIRGYKQRLYNALSERIPAEGGFLIPEVLRSEIMMVALEQSVIRPKARVIPMDSLRVPLPMIDDTSHATNVYGGVQAYWTAEGASLTASAPSFGRIELEARKLTAYTTIPNELLQDAVTPLDSWFNMFFPRAMAWFEDIAFISGTGVGEPQGILNAPAAIKVNTANSSTIVWADVAAAYSRMWPSSLNSAVWLCSPDVLVELLTLTQATNVSPPLWLDQFQALGTPGGGSGDGVGYRLMGRPLVVTEKMPSYLAANSTVAGALTFVDLDYYLIGDRMSMQIATSEEYLFASDLVAYRVIERLDGRFWLQSAITPAGTGGSTLSPLVLLDTPHV